METPKFNILDKVYHITPESPIGVVIEIKYTYSSGMHEFQVAFSHDTPSLWYFDYELSTSKTYK